MICTFEPSDPELRTGGVLCIKVAPFSVALSELVHRELRNLVLDTPARQVLVEFESDVYMSSNLISIIIDLTRHMSELRRSICIVYKGETAVPLLDIIRRYGVIECHETRAAAFAAMKDRSFGFSQVMHLPPPHTARRTAPTLSALSITDLAAALAK